jgi:CRP/FNR family transcriptional regulator, cyclic AMP receptor protein
MNFTQSYFKVTKTMDCPFYTVKDIFTVMGRSIALLGKPTCITLMGDITQVLVTLQGSAQPRHKHTFTCGGYATGCCGQIQLEYSLETGAVTEDACPDPETYAASALAGELFNFSIFKTLQPAELNEIASYFKAAEFRKNDIILRKGERGDKFFVILSGKVDIVGDYGLVITSLGRGEVFGEMSLLTGNPVSAKVRAAEDTTAIFMHGNYFRRILSRFSPLQQYFNRLLVKRLAQSNLARSKESAAGMTGSISEISVPELLQALNMAQKTGILTLALPGGTARILMRDGQLIQARYGEVAGQEAVFNVLREKRGDFKFKPGLPPKEMDTPKIGEFMFLLMEGMRRLDDAEAPDEEAEEGAEEDLFNFDD